MKISLQILVDNDKLMWLDDQRYRSNDLAIPMSIDDKNWNERFESLLNFADEFGHCNVPMQREYPLPSGITRKLTLNANLLNDFNLITLYC